MSDLYVIKLYNGDYADGSQGWTDRAGAFVFHGDDAKEWAFGHAKHLRKTQFRTRNGIRVYKLKDKQLPKCAVNGCGASAYGLKARSCHEHFAEWCASGVDPFQVWLDAKNAPKCADKHPLSSEPCGLPQDHPGLHKSTTGSWSSDHKKVPDEVWVQISDTGEPLWVHPSKEEALEFDDAHEPRRYVLAK